jgi:hypothetical protein
VNYIASYEYPPFSQVDKRLLLIDEVIVEFFTPIILIKVILPILLRGSWVRIVVQQQK